MIRKYRITKILSISALLIIDAFAANPPVFLPVEGQDDDVVKFKASDEGKGKEYTTFAKAMISTIKIDTAGLKKVLDDLDLPDKFIEVVDEASTSMTNQIKAQTTKMVDEAQKVYDKELADLETEVKFLGNYLYFTGCCADTKWSAIHGNPNNQTKAGASGAISIDLRPSVSFIAGAEIQIELKAGSEIEYEITKISGINPTTAVGKNVEVLGNPFWKLTIKGTISAEALMSLTVGKTIGYSGTLEQVLGTLESGCN